MLIPFEATPSAGTLFAYPLGVNAATDGGSSVKAGRGVGTLTLEPRMAVQSWSIDGYFCVYGSGCDSVARGVMSREAARRGGWFCTEIYVDGKGREWERSWTACVDDFGSLVEVSQ